MTYLTQKEIENLGPEEYCQLLAYGDIELVGVAANQEQAQSILMMINSIDDDEFSHEYHPILRSVEFDL